MQAAGSIGMNDELPKVTSPDVQQGCIALLFRNLSVPRVLLGPGGINLNSSMQVTPTGAVGIQSHGTI